MDFKSRYTYDTQKDLLGRGGFARVYKAYDVLLDRLVAVKVFTTHDKDKYNVLEEIKKAIRLEHPSLLRYYDVAMIDGQNSFGEKETMQIGVMELANYGDLKTFTKANYDPYVLKELLIQVLEGMVYLHKRGIIHRDLKPQNILLVEESGIIGAKISDFGISKNLSSGGTSSSAVVGTIEYMAPEQFNPAKYGINGKIGTNVDIWSFGIMVFELIMKYSLFGSRGHDTSAEQIMSSILSPTLPPVVDEMPEPYKTLVKKCLVSDASKRAASATALIEILRLTPPSDTVTPENKAPKGDGNPNDQETLVIPYRGNADYEITKDIKGESGKVNPIENFREGISEPGSIPDNTPPVQGFERFEKDTIKESLFNIFGKKKYDQIEKKNPPEDFTAKHQNEENLPENIPVEKPAGKDIEQEFAKEAPSELEDGWNNLHNAKGESPQESRENQVFDPITRRWGPIDSSGEKDREQIRRKWNEIDQQESEKSEQKTEKWSPIDTPDQEEGGKDFENRGPEDVISNENIESNTKKWNTSISQKPKGKSTLLLPIGIIVALIAVGASYYYFRPSGVRTFESPQTLFHEGMNEFGKENSGFLEELIQAANGGYDSANFALATYFEGKRQIDSAVRWLQPLNDKDNEIAIEKTAGLWVASKDSSKSDSIISYYKKCGQSGNLNCKYQLAMFYYNGFPGKQADFKSALDIFSDAAKAGNAPSQCMLGNLYYEGKGFIKRDYNQAFQWYMKSADQGNEVAIYSLGLCYADGTGVQKNLVIARKYLLRAANGSNQEVKQAAINKLTVLPTQ